MQTQTIPNIPAQTRADPRLTAAKTTRPVSVSKDRPQNERPMGFTRRELRRLVADMIG